MDLIRRQPHAQPLELRVKVIDREPATRQTHSLQPHGNFNSLQGKHLDQAVLFLLQFLRSTTRQLPQTLEC